MNTFSKSTHVSKKKKKKWEDTFILLPIAWKFALDRNFCLLWKYLLGVKHSLLSLLVQGVRQPAVDTMVLFPGPLFKASISTPKLLGASSVNLAEYCPWLQETALPNVMPLPRGHHSQWVAMRIQSSSSLHNLWQVGRTSPTLGLPVGSSEAPVGNKHKPEFLCPILFSHCFVSLKNSP